MEIWKKARLLMLSLWFQTIETDGVSSAEAFIIDGVHYLVITNKGNHNRYQTMSRLYRVNEGGHLTLVSL